jgi:hypothetical protein
MDLDISSDSDLENAILEDLLPKPCRPRQVSKNDKNTISINLE